MKNRNLELCLCERCVAGFYQSKEYWVTREDPYQVIKDECAFCKYEGVTITSFSVEITACRFG